MTIDSTRSSNVAVPQSGIARPIDLKAGRRAFMQTLGLGLAGSALAGSAAFTPAAAQAVTDADILNFALNLEYLEAEFYLRAVYGTGLNDDEVSGTGRLGPVKGGRKVDFTDRSIQNYAVELATEERLHVNFLRKGLGGAKVARPPIDLSGGFTNAARAAGLVGANENFDAFASDTNFLLASFIFEDVGVTAYLGAVPLVSDKGLLRDAAAIGLIEAYHAGTVRTVAYGMGLFTQTQAISDLRDRLTGGDRDQGIGSTREANIAPSSMTTGLAFYRTTRQVLNIVYGAQNAEKGLFFPSGMNGTIR